MNKIFNYCILSLLSVLTLTLGSCTEEYDYVKQKAKGQQVYFSNSLSSSVTITDNGAHFIVPINRIDTSEELTVNLTATDESGVLTIPSTVTFKAGESEANITIDYDPSQIEADTYYDVTLAVADADYTTPYGESSYAFSIVMWPPVTELGVAKFTDTNFGINQYSATLYQINGTNRFRLSRPYDLLSGTNGPDYLQFEILQAGDTYPTGAQVTESDMVFFDNVSLGYDIFNIGTPTEMWHPSNLMNMDVTHNRVLAYQDNGLPGAIQLAPYYYAYSVQNPDGTTSVYGSSYAENDGVITITFPDYVYNPKDYTVSVTGLGSVIDSEDAGYAMANVTLGEDVNEVRVGIVEGTNTALAYMAVRNGTVPTTTVSENGEVRIPCGYTGDCTWVAIAYAYNEENQLEECGRAFATTTIYSNGSWVSLGEGLYTDYLVAPLFVEGEDEEGNPIPFDPITYPVEVQENVAQPGVYRLMRPYAPDVFGYGGGFGYDETSNYNIIIDAHDPDAVYMTLQQSGVGIYVCSYGGFVMLNYGLSFDQAKALGMINAKLENGVITFAAQELMLGILDATTGTINLGIPEANYESPVDVLVLPSAVNAQSMAKAKAKAQMMPFAAPSSKKMMPKSSLHKVQKNDKLNSLKKFGKLSLDKNVMQIRK